MVAERIEALLKRLRKQYITHVAKTGTIYITVGKIFIRIADHPGGSQYRKGMFILRTDCDNPLPVTCARVYGKSKVDTFLPFLEHCILCYREKERRKRHKKAENRRARKRKEKLYTGQNICDKVK
jgi:hypothetical protein